MEEQLILRHALASTVTETGLEWTVEPVALLLVPLDNTWTMISAAAILSVEMEFLLPMKFARLTAVLIIPDVPGTWHLRMRVAALTATLLLNLAMMEIVALLMTSATKENVWEWDRSLLKLTLIVILWQLEAIPFLSSITSTAVGESPLI